MTDVKEAVARLREWSNNKGQTSIRSGDIDAVLDHLEDELARVLAQADAEREGWRKVIAEAGDTARMRIQALNELKAERDKLREQAQRWMDMAGEAAQERDKLREELESARRVVNELRLYKAKNEYTLQNAIRLLERHDARFGGRDDASI
jgi:hypothetical protein